jgi:hypothetical protein
MCRIPAFICLSFICGGFGATAAEGEATYQIGWTTAKGTVCGSVFQATPEEASGRLAWANRFDPSTKHWLVQRPSPETRENATAQPAVQGHGPKVLYRISVAAALGANAMDIASSYGKLEVNPLFQGAGGRFDARSVALKSGLVGGLQACNYLAVRKHPEYSKRATIINFAVSAVFAGLAAHNFGIHAGH